MKRISILVLILCACFVPVAWSQQPARKCYNSWAEFHRYNMWRWNRCEKVLNVHNVGSLGLKWRYDPDYGGVSTAPAVANGVVYVGTDNGSVFALDARTGTVLWSYTTAGFVQSSPAVANGVVYFGSADNNVYALNASTGAKLWSYATGSGWPVTSSPAVANGVVYVGSDDHNVYALNATTGALLWSYTTGGCVDSSPAVANGVVYVGSDDHNVYALNASTGAKLWSYTTGAPCKFLARGSQWRGVCRLLGPQRVRAERQHRRQAVELHHWRALWILRPQSPMAWCMSAPTTTTCTR